MKKSIQKIQMAISEEKMMDHVREIASFHRIQASTGYRAAANYCAKQLRTAGFECQIKAYKADGEAWNLASKTFKEWRMDDGYCYLVTPEQHVLADFKADNISVIQKSYPCDYRETPLEVVLLDRGNQEEAYEGVDLLGKMIFVRDHIKHYQNWAIKKRGAVGILTDFMPELKDVRRRDDMLDLRNYTSFWWKHAADEPKSFGFVLSPRIGDALAETCRDMARQHNEDPSAERYPKVACYVDSDVYNGQIEVVETLLKGETEEEVLIIAHLCHPKSSANDNASGVAAGMEIVRVLRDLIERKDLLPLKRSVRLCFVPEFTGTYAFLNDLGEERKRILAGINLDMVGGSQEKGYGPIALTGLPHAAPSFILDLASYVLDEVKQEFEGHSKGSYMALFNSRIGPFEAVSDHYILSDPTIGIPTIMLGQWPDMYYHTSGDVLERIDPFILHKSASIAASFVYSLSNLSVEDVSRVMNKSRETLVETLGRIMDGDMEKAFSVDRLLCEVTHYSNVLCKATEDYLRFFKGNEKRQVEALVLYEIRFIVKVSTLFFKRHLEAIGKTDFGLGFEQLSKGFAEIPRRLYISPISNLEEHALGSEKRMKLFAAYEKKHRFLLMDAFRMEALVQYYMDGKRTVHEISQALVIETGEEKLFEDVHAYIRLLYEFGMVEIGEESASIRMSKEVLC